MAKLQFFKPMLAAKVTNPATLFYPLLASPKLDGVRATVQHGQVWSRNLKLIPNAYVQQIFGRAGLNGLDGELVVGPPADGSAVFRRTSSAVMSVDGKPEVTFWVIDAHELLYGVKAEHTAFHKRLVWADKLIRRARHDLPNWPIRLNNRSLVQSCLQKVPQQQIDDVEALQRFERFCLGEGYEGICMRDPFGKYKQGRSTLREGGLLKLKRFKDGEARILGVLELLHNENTATINALGHTERSTHKANRTAGGTMGALHVRDLKTKVAFNIGTGFSAEERRSFWDFRDEAVGKIVRYKFLQIGMKDKPRHPVFTGLRDKRDI